MSFDGKSVLAVVPARGGSVGVPFKNMRRINGKTLVAHAADVAAAVPEIDRRICSTDREVIAVEATNAGLSVIKRPNNLSNGFAGDAAVTRHALETIEAIDKREYDIIVLLQPTSVLRRAEDVSKAIRMLVNGEWDSVWTVSETEPRFHPWKQLTVSDLGHMTRNRRQDAVVARQQLPPSYTRNGVAYVVTRSCLVSRGMIGDLAGALVLDETHISIDTEEDLEGVERILNGRGGVQQLHERAAGADQRECTDEFEAETSGC